jgi:hypothetical protein
MWNYGFGYRKPIYYGTTGSGSTQLICVNAKNELFFTVSPICQVCWVRRRRIDCMNDVKGGDFATLFCLNFLH